MRIRLQSRNELLLYKITVLLLWAAALYLFLHGINGSENHILLSLFSLIYYFFFFYKLYVLRAHLLRAVSFDDKGFYYFINRKQKWVPWNRVLKLEPHLYPDVHKVVLVEENMRSREVLFKAHLSFIHTHDLKTSEVLKRLNSYVKKAHKRQETAAV